MFFFLQAYRIFNTWMGDPARNALLESVLDTVENDRLIERTQSAGKVLMDGLVQMQVRISLFHETLYIAVYPKKTMKC